MTSNHCSVSFHQRNVSIKESWLPKEEMTDFSMLQSLINSSLYNHTWSRQHLHILGWTRSLDMSLQTCEILSTFGQGFCCLPKFQLQILIQQHWVVIMYNIFSTLLKIFSYQHEFIFWIQVFWYWLVVIYLVKMSKSLY